MTTRRTLISWFGAAAASWPLVARAQERRPTVGFLASGSAATFKPHTAAFHRGLAEVGFVEGRDVAIEYRWAEGRRERSHELVADLIRRHVDVIFGGGSEVGLAAKAVTKTIPIVFTGGSDPVALGLVSSLNRPGGNVTGVTMIAHTIGAKRMEVLRQLLPNATVIAMLLEIGNPSATELARDSEAAAAALGLKTAVFWANSEATLEAAFAAIVRERADGLFVGGGALMGNLRDRIVALQFKHAMPTMFSIRDYVEAGGLMSYGASYVDTWRQAGVYVGRILKGERPADLPVQQPTKFDFVVNLRTAKSLNLTLPPTLLALVDEVIE